MSFAISSLELVLKTLQGQSKSLKGKWCGGRRKKAGRAQLQPLSEGEMKGNLGDGKMGLTQLKLPLFPGSNGSIWYVFLMHKWYDNFSSFKYAKFE